MSGASRRSRPAAAIGLTAAGGVLVLVGTLLVWFKASGPVTDSITGVEMVAGKMVLGLGVLVAICGGLIAVLDSRVGRMVASIAGLVLAAVAALFCLYSAYAPLDAFAQFAAGEAGLGAAAAGEIKQALLESGVSISAGIGAWCASAGSVLAVVGGVAGIVAARRIPRPTPARGRT